MYQVISFLKNGTEIASKSMTWNQAVALWERKNSRSPRRFSVRKAAL